MCGISDGLSSFDLRNWWRTATFLDVPRNCKRHRKVRVHYVRRLHHLRLSSSSNVIRNYSELYWPLVVLYQSINNYYCQAFHLRCRNCLISRCGSIQIFSHRASLLKEMGLLPLRRKIQVWICISVRSILYWGRGRHAKLLRDDSGVRLGSTRRMLHLLRLLRRSSGCKFRAKDLRFYQNARLWRENEKV